MNFLAHIQTAHHTQTSMVDSVMGDFVRGALPESSADPQILAVWLHRKIDQFTDSHSEIKYCVATFPSSMRRWAPIILDVYFDHALATHWDTYSDAPMSLVLDTFYTELDNHQEPSGLNIQPRWMDVKQRMLAHKWLATMTQLESVHASLRAIETRLQAKRKGQIAFANVGFDFLAVNQTTLNARFHDFYPQLLAFAAAWANSDNQN